LCAREDEVRVWKEMESNEKNNKEIKINVYLGENKRNKKEKRKR